MVLIPELAKQKVSGSPSSFDVAAAKKLREAVLLKRKSQRSIHVGLWARQFQRLREIDGFDEPHIQSILDWYVTVIGKEYVPEAHSGEGFRNKFEQIERAMERGLPNLLVVTELAKEIAKWADNQLNWPKGSATQLPAFAQQSLENYQKFLDKFMEFRRTADKGSRTYRLTEHLLPYLPRKRDFVMTWIANVHSRVARWADWSGDLKPFVFRPDHKLFQSEMRTATEAYSGSTELWETLEKALR